MHCFYLSYQGNMLSIDYPKTIDFMRFLEKVLYRHPDHRTVSGSNIANHHLVVRDYFIPASGRHLNSQHIPRGKQSYMTASLFLFSRFLCFLAYVAQVDVSNPIKILVPHLRVKGPLECGGNTLYGCLRVAIIVY